MRPMGLSPGSWIFGPHFWYKVYYIFPTGFAFGIKYAVTNWSIQLVSSDLHVVLGATDLFWILLLARIINKEKMGILEFLSVSVCVVGIVLVTLHKVTNIEGTSIVPIFANLLAPFVGAFCVTTLRAGIQGLFEPSNRLQGTTTKIEFTAIKLGISTLAAFLTGMIFENGVVHITNTEKALPDAWWVALSDYPIEGTFFVCATGILTFIFHVNLAWLCQMTSATAIGLMQEVKVLPQYAFNAIFTAMGVVGLTVDTSFMNLLGTSLGLLGAALYALSSHVSHTQGKLFFGRQGIYFKEPSMSHAGEKVLPNLVSTNSSGCQPGDSSGLKVSLQQNEP